MKRRENITKPEKNRQDSCKEIIESSVERQISQVDDSESMFDAKMT